MQSKKCQENVFADFAFSPVLTHLNSVLYFVAVKVLVKISSEVSTLNSQRNAFGRQVAEFFDDENCLPSVSSSSVSMPNLAPRPLPVRVRPGKGPGTGCLRTWPPPFSTMILVEKMLDKCRRTVRAHARMSSGRIGWQASA